MSFWSVLLGRRLANEEDAAQRIGPIVGVSTFGLDALGSAAYGPEAALTILLPLGAAGLGWILPLSGAVIALLAVVTVSYRQTIAAYPSGGGSYLVAHRNLGTKAGLTAAAALMIDYILNVAVGISTGVGAVVSSWPALHPYTLELCLVILALLTIANLRGTRESGLLMLLPTYIFVFGLLGVIVVGLIKTILAGGHPVAVVPPPIPPQSIVGSAGLWLLLKAFANGCTAMTGVEAVSNGVPAFREPVVKSARRTLAIIITLLMMLLAGIAVLTRAYGIGATPPGQSGYQSILSQLVAAIAGRGPVYFVLICAILAVLSLSANTSFADFPRLCHAVALDRYLPYGFALRGRRLVYTAGIIVLASSAAALLIAFRGVTDRLIPLFAVGAFLSFTLSQAGMVAHWKKQPNHHRGLGLWLNAFGCAVTSATFIVIVTAKFNEGAWVTLLAIPVLVAVMSSVGRHYRRVASEISNQAPLAYEHLREPIAVVPVDAWDRVAKKALHFAMTLSHDVRALHIDCGESSPELSQRWNEWVVIPAQAAGRPPPELILLHSPYRLVISPIITHVLDLELREPNRFVAVIVSNLVERRRYQRMLHNRRAEVLTEILTRRGDRRIVVINVPWYLDA